MIDLGAKGWMVLCVGRTRAGCDVRELGNPYRCLKRMSTGTHVFIE
jgi:hypothetical protein